jgi:D-arabinitol 4-dehydrogenase
MRRILHLGLGAFHRAHQAVYLQRLHDLGANDWTLAGGNIRGDMLQTIEALVAQRGQYTLETIAADGAKQYERIRSIRQIVPFDTQLEPLIELGARPDTRIISFTVTEAGYFLDAAHQLDTRHPDVRSDLEGRTRCTLYGVLAAIVAERARRGSGPVTFLSCDNVRSNGTRLRSCLFDFLDLRGDDSTTAWVRTHATCPNSMVDRITPRLLPDVAERVHAATGWTDRAPVMSERFIQWVIEDDFANGRPDWERVGVELVQSVSPYEEAKIRLLNASHSCIAWAGTLIGLRFIHEGVRVPAIRRMAYEYLTQDAIPVLSPSPIDLTAYRDIVLERFSNPHLRDGNPRVAMDGYSKVPGFIVPTIRERLDRGQSIARTAVLPALFFNFLRRWHRGELDDAYQDAAMDPAAARALFDASDPLAAFCADPALWGPLAGSPELIRAIRSADREVADFVASAGAA